MAAEFRLPIIRIIEGSGGGGSVKTIETKGAANLPGGIGGTRWLLAMTATWPRCRWSGWGSARWPGWARRGWRPAHFSVMTKASAMFVAGPPVVARLGQELDKQELGGAEIQTRSRRRRQRRRHRGGGLRLRAALPVLPAVVGLRAAAGAALRRRPGARRRIADERGAARPAQGLQDAARSSRRWSTSGSFFEMGRNFGRSIITGLARLDGRAGAAAGQRPLPLRRRRGRPRPARRWCASSTWPRPSTCRWST